MFVGREQELAQLEKFADRKTAGLLVCSGRRRVGKSTLIEHFASKRQFYEFYGLSPRDDLTNQIQLDHFGELMGEVFKVPAMHFSSWNEALSTLAGLTQNTACVILLDEISWLASKDKDFPGKLKGVWDTKFKKNSRLILVLCGSVSSWIQENILNDKGFMGRISLEMDLQELSLNVVKQFWGKVADRISNTEIFKILNVTGGIPRYLEEIRAKETAEQNIKRLCFTEGAVLVKEFDKIFKDIFQKHSELYKSIVKIVVNQSLSSKEICERLNIKQSGSFNKKLRVLCESQFLARDYVWEASRRTKKLSKYRLKDNYLRFYLKYIEPKRDLIDKGLYHELHLEDLPDWPSIMGLQFENLVLNNLKIVLKKLEISPASLISASPHFQYKTKRKQSCQIDLLIHTQYCIYVCEIKFRKKIQMEVIEEVAEKIKRVSFPKYLSIRPILIYQGELSTKIKVTNFFSHLISFEDLLE